MRGWERCATIAAMVADAGGGGAGALPFTPDEVAYFRENGHVLLRQLIPRQQALALAEPVLRLLELKPLDTRPWDERPPLDRVYEISGDLHLFDPSCREVVFSPRIATAAAQLLGTDGVRLFFDEAVNKPPTAVPTPWHRDGVYWGIDQSHLDLPPGMDCIRIWITLTDLLDDTSALAFVSGSHRVPGKSFGFGAPGFADPAVERLPPVEQLPFPEGEHHDATVDGKDGEVVLYQGLRAGDATFHAGGTMHAASRNRSGVDRPVLAVTHMPPGTRMGPNPPDIQREIFAPHQPGDVLDGPKHPLLGRVGRR